MIINNSNKQHQPGEKPPLCIGKPQCIHCFAWCETSPPQSGHFVNAMIALSFNAVYQYPSPLSQDGIDTLRLCRYSETNLGITNRRDIS